MYGRENPETSRILSPQEVRKLRSVLEETYIIHNQGDTLVQSLEIRPGVFIRAISNELRHRGVEVADVRINGGAASYILNPTTTVKSASLSTNSSTSSLLVGSSSSSRSHTTNTSISLSGSSTRTNPTPKSTTPHKSARNTSEGLPKKANPTDTAENRYTRTPILSNPYESQKRYFTDLDVVIRVNFDVAVQGSKFDTIRGVVVELLTEHLNEVNPGENASQSAVSNAFINKMFKMFDESNATPFDGDLWSLISLHNRIGRSLELKFVHTMKRQYEFTTDSFQIVVSNSFLDDLHKQHMRNSSTMPPLVLPTFAERMSPAHSNEAQSIDQTDSKSFSQPTQPSRPPLPRPTSRRLTDDQQTASDSGHRGNGPIVVPHQPIRSGVSLPHQQNPVSWIPRKNMSPVIFPDIPERPQRPPRLASASPPFDPHCMMPSSHNPAAVAASLCQPLRRTSLAPNYHRASYIDPHRRVSICLGEKRKRRPLNDPLLDMDFEDLRSESIGIPPSILQVLSPDLKESARNSTMLPDSCLSSYLYDFSYGGRTQFVVHRGNHGASPGRSDSTESATSERGLFIDSDDSRGDAWDSALVSFPAALEKSKSSTTCTDSPESDLSDFGGSFNSNGIAPHELGLESKEESELLSVSVADTDITTTPDAPSSRSSVSPDPVELSPSGNDGSDEGSTTSEGSSSRCATTDLTVNFAASQTVNPSPTPSNDLAIVSESVEVKHDDPSDVNVKKADVEDESEDGREEAEIHQLYALTLYNSFQAAYYDLCHRKITVDKPEEIRGGGLLRFCDLSFNGYELSDKYSAVEKEKLQSTMLVRFFMDYEAEQSQHDAVQSYLKSHYINRDWVKKRGFLQKILETGPRIKSNHDETVDGFMRIVEGVMNEIVRTANQSNIRLNKPIIPARSTHARSKNGTDHLSHHPHVNGRPNSAGAIPIPRPASMPLFTHPMDGFLNRPLYPHVSLSGDSLTNTTSVPQSSTPELHAPFGSHDRRTPPFSEQASAFVHPMSNGYNHGPLNGAPTLHSFMFQNEEFARSRSADLDHGVPYPIRRPKSAGRSEDRRAYGFSGEAGRQRRMNRPFNDRHPEPLSRRHRDFAYQERRREENERRERNDNSNRNRNRNRSHSNSRPSSPNLDDLSPRQNAVNRPRSAGRGRGGTQMNFLDVFTGGNSSRDGEVSAFAPSRRSNDKQPTSAPSLSTYGGRGSSSSSQSNRENSMPSHVFSSRTRSGESPSGYNLGKNTGSRDSLSSTASHARESNPKGYYSYLPFAKSHSGGQNSSDSFSRLPTPPSISENQRQSTVLPIPGLTPEGDGFRQLPPVVCDGMSFQPILQSTHSPQVMAQLHHHFSSPQQQQYFQFFLQMNMNTINQEKNKLANSVTNSNPAGGGHLSGGLAPPARRSNARVKIVTNGQVSDGRRRSGSSSPSSQDGHRRPSRSRAWRNDNSSSPPSRGRKSNGN